MVQNIININRNRLVITCNNTYKNNTFNFKINIGFLLLFFLLNKFLFDSKRSLKTMLNKVSNYYFIRGEPHQ